MIGIPIEIDYGSGVLSAGVTAHIIASNRPLARLAVHDIRMAAGEQQVVDLFDGAYNPFPQKPLRATSCDIGDVQNLKVSCAENGRLAISATPDIRAGTYIITVTIRDGTDSAQREATSNISVAVTAVPNPPLLSPVSDQTLDSRVQLSWIPGESNGSPVLEYRVDYDNGHSQSCGVATTCTITGLQNGREYTFSVAARNEAGWSKPSLSVNAIPDATPTPVENITIEGGYQQATVRWSKPQFQGTAPSEYIVTISNSQCFNRTQTISDALNAIFPIDHDATGDGVTFSATVFARNRAGSSPVAQSTRTTVVWSNPDTPELQLIQEGNQLLATVRFADMHNAGCATIKLSGDVIKELDCNDPTASATIPQRFYWREMKVMASIAPRLPKAQEANTSATITPQYAVQKVSELQVFGEKDTCIVSLKPHGQYDGFVVESPKLGTQTLDADTIAARFTLQPWQQCGPVGVRQTLNGTTGPQVDAVSDYTYKIPAKITVPTLVWSQDHQHVTLSASSVNTWGQPAIIRIIITVNNQQYPYMWCPGLSSLDVGNLPESPDYPYVLDVESAAADAALHAISEIQYIEGIRKGIGMKSSNVQMDSTPWQHLQENRQIWNIIRERHHSS
jgi:hypothetical protein